MQFDAYVDFYMITKKIRNSDVCNVNQWALYDSIADKIILRDEEINAPQKPDDDIWE